MKGTGAGLLATFAAALGVAVAAQAIHLRDLKQEVARLKIRGAAAAAEAEAERATAPEPAGPDAPSWMADREPAPPDKAPEPPGLPSEEILRLIEERVGVEVERRIEEQGLAPQGGRTMKLALLSDKLGLDPSTETAVAQVADGAKRDIFALVHRPRGDGSSLADEVVDALLSGDEALTKRTLAKFLVDRLPGTDDSYLTAVTEVQDRADEELRRIVPRDAFTRYLELALRPEDIQTGFDPWGELLRMRAAAR